MRARVCRGIALSMAVACSVGLGCSGEIDDPGDDDDDGGGTVTLAFTTPTAGTSFARDTVEPSLGARAATIDVELAVTGMPASIELSAGDIALGAIDVAGRGQALLVEAGATTLIATARDAAGTAVATASVDVMVVEPQVADCHGWLDLYGAAYEISAARPGVADPITLTGSINGLPYRYLGNVAVRPTFFMDCSLARSLLEAAPYLRARGVVEVTDIGVYNYRCIGTGTPPNCPSGMSQHAYAKAIDIAGFTDVGGTFYSVNDDWVIDPAAERTCDAGTTGDKDTFLHEAICELKDHAVWNIVLTPNYNADHRNHFHVDLTAGSNFIRRRFAIDDGPDGH